jgi:hypothetical protein
LTDADLLKKFEMHFESMKKELKFKATLKELDEIFFVNDFIHKEGFVSTNLSRQLARRIVELYISWAQYLHGLLIMNPNSLTSIAESQAFTEKEKEEHGKLFDRLMVISTEHTYIGLTKDKKREAAFFDSAVSLWKEISPQLIEIMKKVGKQWDERSHAKPKKQDEEYKRIYG